MGQWLEGLPATQRKNAERLLGLIRGIELEDEEERKQLYLSGMLAFERLRLRCFWHGCQWHGTVPKTNRQLWTARILRNRHRDKRVDQSLKNLGWKVLRVWEHEVQTDTSRVLRRIERLLNS